MTRGLPWLQRDFRFHPRLAGGHPGAAYELGLRVLAAADVAGGRTNRIRKGTA